MPQMIHPTTTWQTMPSSQVKDEFEVATDLFYFTKGRVPHTPGETAGPSTTLRSGPTACRGRRDDNFVSL